MEVQHHQLLHRPNPCTLLYRYHCRCCSPNLAPVPIHVKSHWKAGKLLSPPGPSLCVRGSGTVKSIDCRADIWQFTKAYCTGAYEDSVYKWPSLVLIYRTGCRRNMWSAVALWTNSKKRGDVCDLCEMFIIVMVFIACVTILL